MPKKALHGIKILEYCTNVSGAYATKLMADMGAEVIKIESPHAGDDARRKGPFPQDDPHPEKSAHFFSLNSNKLGITLSPTSATGKTLFTRLIEGTDILVEDTPPGDLEANGLSYSALSELNPGLIMCSITPYGLSGPYKNYKARHLNTSHVSGQGYILPIPAKDNSRPPVMIGGNKGGYDAGVNAVVAILAAYYWKNLSGKGQFIEISRQEGLISMQRIETTTFPNDGVNTSRFSDKRRQYIGGVIPCRDGYITILAPLEHQWQSLLKLMGNPPWSQEEIYAHRVSRQQHAHQINEYLKDWMKDKYRDEVVKEGQALSIPVSPVNTAEDIVTSKQFAARQFFTEVQHPQMGTLKFPTAPYRFSQTPWSLDRFAPRLGESNHEIFVNRLGYSPDDLVRFRQARII